MSSDIVCLTFIVPRTVTLWKFGVLLGMTDTLPAPPHEYNFTHVLWSARQAGEIHINFGIAVGTIMHTF